MPEATRIMSEMCEELDAQRAICLVAEHPRQSTLQILKSRLFEEVPNHRSRALVTIEREVCRGLPSVKAEWRRRPGNGEYEWLLATVARYGRLDLYTSEMPDSFLKTIYVRDGVHRAVVMTLGHDALHLQRYLSVQWTKHWFEPVDAPFKRYAALIGKTIRGEMSDEERWCP